MATTNKREEVEKLDNLLRTKMIEALENDTLEILTLLSAAIQYVKANEVTLEKEKGSVEKSIEDRTKEAERRRLEKENGKKKLQS